MMDLKSDISPAVIELKLSDRQAEIGSGYEFCRGSTVFLVFYNQRKSEFELKQRVILVHAQGTVYQGGTALDR